MISSCYNQKLRNNESNAACSQALRFEFCRKFLLCSICLSGTVHEHPWWLVNGVVLVTPSPINQSCLRAAPLQWHCGECNLGSGEFYPSINNKRSQRASLYQLGSLKRMNEIRFSRHRLPAHSCGDVGSVSWLIWVVAHGDQCIMGHMQRQSDEESHFRLDQISAPLYKLRRTFYWLDWCQVYDCSGLAKPGIYHVSSAHQNSHVGTRSSALG